jgi:hypothetical protein
MQDDEEEKRQGPSATGADHSPSPLQQLKALCNKLDTESEATHSLKQAAAPRFFLSRNVE